MKNVKFSDKKLLFQYKRNSNNDFLSKNTTSSLTTNFNNTNLSSNAIPKNLSTFEASIKNDQAHQLIRAAESAIQTQQLTHTQSKIDNIFSSWLPQNKQLEMKKHLGSGLPALAHPGSNMNNVAVEITNNSYLNRNIDTIFLEPLANAEELIYLNPMNQSQVSNYYRTRVLFSINLFMSTALIILEISAIVHGILWMNRCQMIDIFLLVSGCMHIFIIMLEWARVWVWGGSSNPVVPDSNSDHMIVLITFILVLVYMIAAVWYCVGFAWIPLVFLNFLKKRRDNDINITIYKGNLAYESIIPVCTMDFYTYACCYQVLVGLVFLIRLTFCCMSDFCKGICGKLVGPGSTSQPCDDEGHSPLEVYLPPLRTALFKWGWKDPLSTDSGLQALYSSHRLSMIPPIPVYSNAAQFNNMEVIENKSNIWSSGNKSVL